MRKAALALAVIAVLIALAAPALAQPAGARDPFDPVIDLQPATTTAGETQGAVQGAPQEPAATGATGEAERLANTGSDATPWFVAAYALIASGAGALVLARTLRPA